MFSFVKTTKLSSNVASPFGPQQQTVTAPHVLSASGWSVLWVLATLVGESYRLP